MRCPWPALGDLVDEGLVPVPAEALEYLISEGWVEGGMAAQVCRPRWVTPAPSYVEGSWFDVGAVVRVCQAFAGLRHTKTRKWAGRPLRLEPWQVVFGIAPVFGWKHSLELDDPDLPEPGTRIVRTWYQETPRKQGKSTTASGLALYLVAYDLEPAPEVYSAAVDRAQASLVFDPAKRMAQASPGLRDAVRVLRGLLEVPSSGGIYRTLSSVAQAAHGLNVHGGVIDELHVHPNRDLLDAIMTGVGARDQPLVAIITTADDGREGTIYDEQHGAVVNQAERVADPESETYGCIWAADDEDDPFDEATWWKANPNLGVSVGVPYLRGEATKARNRPGYLATFCRLHLGMRMAGGAGMFDMEQWRAAGMFVRDDERCLDLEGFAGLHVQSTADLCSWVIVFPDVLDGRPGWRLLTRHWLPEDTLRTRRVKMAGMLRTWADQGWLTLTPGNVRDDERIVADVGADVARYNLVEWAYAPWQSESIRQAIDAMQDSRDPDRDPGDGWGWACQQSMVRLAGPSDELYRAIEARALAHNGDPVLAWCASNAVARSDTEKRIRPDTKASRDSIAALSALLTALAAGTRQRKPEEPVYEPRVRFL